MHSIAAALMLKKDEIHFFNDIAYYHVPFTHCPTGEKIRLQNKCHCNPHDNFDWNGYSCEFPTIPFPLRLLCPWENLATSTKLIDPRVLTRIGTARYFEINNMQKPEGYEKEQS